MLVNSSQQECRTIPTEGDPFSSYVVWTKVTPVARGAGGADGVMVAERACPVEALVVA